MQSAGLTTWLQCGRRLSCARTCRMRAESTANGAHCHLRTAGRTVRANCRHALLLLLLLFTIGGSSHFYLYFLLRLSFRSRLHLLQLQPNFPATSICSALAQIYTGPSPLGAFSPLASASKWSTVLAEGAARLASELLVRHSLNGYTTMMARQM